MKTFVLVATTLLVNSMNVMPVFAAPCDEKTQSAVVETDTAKYQGVRLFHSRRHVALKQAPQNSDNTQVVQSGSALDYNTDRFIIN